MPAERLFRVVDIPGRVRPLQSFPLLLRVLVFALWSFQPLVVAADIRVDAGIDSPLVEFAVNELRSAMSKSSGSADFVLQVKAGQPESFSIHRSGSRITIEGGDLKGLMYGTLEVAEQLRLKGTVEAIRDDTQKPFLPIRALKFNIPLAGTWYVSDEDMKNNEWFWDLEYWQSFFNTAARNRYNSISFWSAHPYDRMVRVAKYPEATSLPATELDRNIEFFKTLFRMARERGLDPYLVTWNIHVSADFAKAHGIADSNFDSELVRDYQRESIKALLATYKDLVGIGTAQGEKMDAIPESKRPAWISDVYFRAVRESGRREVPFILRNWGGTPAATEEAAAAYDSGPIYLDIKYNGEHMYSSTRDHVQDPAWLNQKYSYKMLWHLRNDDIFTFRWGDPGWVRELFRNMAETDSVGFTEGSESDVPGTEKAHNPGAHDQPPWKYKFEKYWFRFALWGRLGYNPDAPDELWQDYFASQLGSAGRPMYDATVAASSVVPTITAYHWNYMNGDWYPEGSIGSWNTSYEQPRVNYRRNEMFHSIWTYIFNSTIDATLEDIPAFVARILADGPPLPPGVRSPLDVAHDLEVAGRAALGASEIPDPGGIFSDEFQCNRLDAEAQGHLGLYYAEKLRGAVALATFMFSGDVTEKASAVAHLRSALDHWKSLAAVTESHYATREVYLFGQFDWNMYTPMVEQDIELAEETTAFARTEQAWQVTSGDGSWQEFDTVVFSSFGRAGLHEWLVYFNTAYNFPRLRQALPDVRSATWKLAARPEGQQGVVELTGDSAGEVTQDGSPVAPVFPEGTRSYSVYGVDDEGEILIQTDSAIPFFSQIDAGDQPIYESATDAVQSTTPPLALGPTGTLSMVEEESRPPDNSGLSPILEDRGTAVFDFRVTTPGFYEVWCLVKNTLPSNARFFYWLDNWIGRGRGHIMTAPAGEGWNWVRSTNGMGMGPGEHSLHLKLLGPGLELKQVRVVPVSVANPAANHSD